MHLERLHTFNDPFSHCWQKEGTSCSVSRQLSASVVIFLNLLTDWQTREWRQLRKTPAVRLDMKGRWCVLSTQLVFFPQLRSQILVMKEFLQRRSHPSPQFPLSSSNSTQGAALKLCKNDIFILCDWCLFCTCGRQQSRALAGCWPVEMLQPGLVEGGGMPGTPHTSSLWLTRRNWGKWGRKELEIWRE